MLTEGGGFSQQKGVGTLAGHTVGGYLSNKRELKSLPSASSRLGLACHEHSYASLSR
jgi:hypothetical protein